MIKQLNPGFGFQILLGSDLGKLDLPIDFDLGVPGLNLKMDAKVTGDLGFDMKLSFGVDLVHGFFVDTRDSFLNVFVDLAMPGLSASGELGFLRLDANEFLKPAEALIGTEKASQFRIMSVGTGSTANFDVRVINQAILAPARSFMISTRVPGC